MIREGESSDGVGTGKAGKGRIRLPRASIHTPVMEEEVRSFLDTAAGQTVVDCTLGDGGHAADLLTGIDPPIRLIGLDRDDEALEGARVRLAEFAGRARLVHADFDQLGSVLAAEGEESVGGILFDFGVSSPQFDSTGRGFSYRADGPLDMRMDQKQGLSAADVVNDYDEAELSRLISRYGQERFAKKIAREIVRNRPITSTVKLAEVVVGAIPAPARRSGRHPARRTFQAIRIEVNGELHQIEAALPQALRALASPGGRMVAISYHSLEDRIVKRFIAGQAQGCKCPPGLPVCGCGRRPTLRDVSGGALRPSKEEIARNRRAESARLRCAVRTEYPLEPQGEEAA